MIVCAAKREPGGGRIAKRRALTLAGSGKRRISRTGTVLLAGLLFCGCARFWPTAENKERQEESAGTRTDTKPAGGSGENAGLQGAKETVFDANGYYYGCLDERLRQSYEVIAQCLAGYGSEVTVSGLEEEELQKVFRSVTADHPELFYVTGYTYSRRRDENGESSFVFSGTYRVSQTPPEEERQVIDDYVRRCFADMPDGDDYVKIRYLYEYLIRNTGYSLDAPDNQNMLSVFRYGQSVCQGYAKAFQYLCEKAGIRATVVTGKIKKTGYGHSWNLVWADGECYYVDVTWGDIGYSDELGAVLQENGHVNYDYLCVTEEQILRTHEIDSDPKMPPCTAAADNYYVREDAYFTEFDETLLEELFAGADDGYVTFACSREDVFRRYEEYLIGQERVFDYMSSPRGIAYCVNEDMLSFGFWLPRN